MRNCIFRIDDRLIHGQVIVGWVNQLNLKEIIVANNELVKNVLRRNLLEISVPEKVQTHFLTLNDTIEYFKSREEKKSITGILLVENPHDALILSNNGLPITEINLGGMQQMGKGKEKLPLAPYIRINKKDARELLILSKKGIIIEGRATPKDKPIDIIKLIKMKESEL